MNDTDRLLGRSQFALSLLIMVGFIGAIAIVLFKARDFSQTQLTIITGLLSTLGTVFTLSANFWFARHRPQSAAADGDNGAPSPNPIPPASPAVNQAGVTKS